MKSDPLESLCSDARLSARQEDCIRLYAEGLDAIGIAERLGIGPGTVETHLKRAKKRIEKRRQWLENMRQVQEWVEERKASEK